MIYSTTITSKGQVTIPADIRRQLGLQPGQVVQFEVQGRNAIVKAPEWQSELAKLHKKTAAHMKKHGIEPVSDKELDKAINTSSEFAASERYKRSL